MHVLLYETATHVATVQAPSPLRMILSSGNLALCGVEAWSQYTPQNYSFWSRLYYCMSSAPISLVDIIYIVLLDVDAL